MGATDLVGRVVASLYRGGPLDQICDMEFVVEAAALKMEIISSICTITVSLSPNSLTQNELGESPINQWIRRSSGRSFTDTDAWKKTQQFNKPWMNRSDQHARNAAQAAKDLKALSTR